MFYIKTKKQYLIRLALLALPLAGLTSCEKDFLEAVPETSISDANAFDTPDRIETLINGLYLSAKSGTFLGGRYQIYNDIRAEEFINRSPNNVTGYDIWQHTSNSNNTYLSNMWTQGYLTINRVNLFLDGLEKNKEKVDAEVYAQYQAEAKFIRALSYFSLVQIFATPYTQDNGASPGLPLRLQPETSSANNGLARSSVAKVYEQILKDLNEAEAGLPETQGSALLNTTRAHKNTAIALKTRVNLVKGDYAGVITEGNKIVSAAAPFTAPTGVKHALQADITSVFKAPYTTAESIFSVPMAATNAPGTQNQLGYYYNAGNLEYYLNTSEPGIYADPQWTADDDRKSKLTAEYSGVGKHLTKFSGVSPYTDFVPVIRYAEVLLNLAEAEARVGDQERALALLEAVHHRSDADYDFGDLSQQELIDAILTERRIELIAEGFRANDIVRTGQPIRSQGAGTDIAPTDPRYIFPIPVSEVNNNPDL